MQTSVVIPDEVMSNKLLLMAYRPHDNTRPRPLLLATVQAAWTPGTKTLQQLLMACQLVEAYDTRGLHIAATKHVQRHFQHTDSYRP